MTRIHIALDLAPSILLLYVVERFFETLCPPSPNPPLPEPRKLAQYGELIGFAAMLSKMITSQDNGHIARIYQSMVAVPGNMGRVVLGDIALDGPMCRSILFVGKHLIRSIELEAMLMRDDLDETSYEDADALAEAQANAVQEMIADCTSDQYRLWTETFAQIRVSFA